MGDMANLKVKLCGIYRKQMRRNPKHMKNE